MKGSNIKFHVIPSSGSRADAFRQTDGHIEANRHSSRLFSRARKFFLI